MQERNRHGTEEVIKKLREVELSRARGESLAAVLQRLEVSWQTIHRWNRKHAGVKVAAAKRQRELQKENARLKGIVVEHEEAGW